MSIVEKSKKNLSKCICMKCPSYGFACKVKSMPNNAILMMGDSTKKIHAEAMFCAYEKSTCIDTNHEKGCICYDCEVFKENDLKNAYFCTVDDGK